MNTSARVAIILVNQGDYAHRYLAECYRSLRVQSYSSGATTLFIVDNSSSERTQKFIHKTAPTARLLRHPQNLGWGGGNNLAIRAALEEGYEYMVLLNIDTVVHPDWLEHLVAEADRDSAVHILQSKILLSGTKIINSMGARMQFLGFGRCRGHGQQEISSIVPIDFVSGASMLVKREVFEQIGLFCEDYFMYYDDTEFCWRARLAGFDVGIAIDSICYHKYDFSRVLNSLYYLERNRLLTLFCLEKWGTILVQLPCLLVSEGVLAIYFFAVGWGGVRWRLWRYFLAKSSWEFMRARRNHVRSIRQRKDAQIVKNFAATIVFPQNPSRVIQYLINPVLWVYWRIARLLIIW